MEVRGVDITNNFALALDKEGNNNIVSPIKEGVSPTIFNPQDKSQLSKTQNEEKKNKNFGKKDLSPEEQKRVEELKQIDAKVRAHEMAHLSAGGGLVRGGANYSYEIGPDGKQYAVAGEVKIDMSVNPDDPEGAIQKMQQVRRAALAPADPSPQDRSVAQQASNIEAQMRAKLLEEKSKVQNKLTKVYKTYLNFEDNSDAKDYSKKNPTIQTPSVESLKRKVNLTL